MNDESCIYTPLFILCVLYTNTIFPQSRIFGGIHGEYANGPSSVMGYLIGSMTFAQDQVTSGGYGEVHGTATRKEIKKTAHKMLKLKQQKSTKWGKA